MIAYVLFGLAALLVVAAVWLWFAPASPSLSTPPPPPAEPSPEAEPDVEPEVEEEPALEVEEEPEPEPEPAPEPEPQLELEQAPEPEPEPEPTPAPEPAPKRPHRMSGLQLPGASRRERRLWAEQHGFRFSKVDEYLVDEWHRGAAASGAEPRDVVAGQVYGHDVRVVDLGGVTVVAVATGEVSDIVVDMRRPQFQADSSADLVLVETVEGFELFTNEPGPVLRFIDVRVRTALREMPESVCAVWCEQDWVLAQLERGSTPQDWEDTFAPLALLADAARTLPPREAAALAPVLGAEEALEPETPQVQRPEEPLELPTRVTGGGFGELEDHEIGADSVAPIADGSPADDGAQLYDLTRVRREQQPSTIFNDTSDTPDTEKEPTDHER
ncbi:MULTISPECIES: hypothetical protein [unclassified Corynebacterium]|uniref:hypothetical protein n=1 Tax=unclassified Corynebacterium TaxID=2624378 RepID=UPI000A456C87|nr:MULTISPECIES: hypothetical protein [unclassified Corynebacterium]WPJ93636.1 hypothetical protein R0V12_04635 [Corynebacterium sp. UMB2355A]